MAHRPWMLTGSKRRFHRNRSGAHLGPIHCFSLLSSYEYFAQQTGTTNNTDCDGTLTGNAGCGITEWSHSSYGPLFDSQGGGVFAMKWDETGIAVWSFYRAAVPTDIVQGSPDPSNWLTPDAALNPSGCDPLTFFVNHSIIFGLCFSLGVFMRHN